MTISMPNQGIEIIAREEQTSNVVSLLTKNISSQDGYIDASIINQRLKNSINNLKEAIKQSREENIEVDGVAFLKFADFIYGFDYRNVEPSISVEIDGTFLAEWFFKGEIGKNSIYSANFRKNNFIVSKFLFGNKGGYSIETYLDDYISSFCADFVNFRRRVAKCI